jgi:hypothetical protein
VRAGGRRLAAGGGMEPQGLSTPTRLSSIRASTSASFAP